MLIRWLEQAKIFIFKFSISVWASFQTKIFGLYSIVLGYFCSGECDEEVVNNQANYQVENHDSANLTEKDSVDTTFFNV